MTPLRFIIFDHQGKGTPLLNALNDCGGMQFPDDPQYYRRLSFVLASNDVQGNARRLQRIHDGGCKNFFLYPHTARPNIINDIFPNASFMTAQFVSAEGHIEVLRRYGVTMPIHSIGWMLCPLREFRPRPQVCKVLFAPIHPRCAEIDQQVNFRTWEILYGLVQKGAIDLTVRYVNDLPSSGLEEIKDGRVRYVRGGLDLNYAEIDTADVVVGHQTYAWMAVARGVPTVMMDEAMPTHTSPRKGPSSFAKHWDDYKDLIQFPLDILHTDDPMALMERAISSESSILGWKQRMIGEAFDPAKFIEVIKGYA